MTPTQDLLPCPFCGGEAYGPLFSHESGSHDVYAVECEACCIDLEGPRMFGKEAAIIAAAERWNTRAALTTPSAKR